MGKQRKKRKLALLLLVTTLLSTVFGSWHGGHKYNVQAQSSDRETLNYFAEGFGTGADFSEDSWEMKTAFMEGASSSITENPNNQAGIVENEHSGKQEKIIRLINARSLDLNSFDPSAWYRVSTAIVGDQVSLKESSEFSAKFTISMPDACINETMAGGPQFVRESGGDGIAFIITPASTIEGSIGTGGMGYYGIKDSLAIELDPYFNGAYCTFESNTDYVNWGYDNQVFGNTGNGYLQALADDTRNKGLEYDWGKNGPNYWTYLNNQGYAQLPASRDRRFDHVGVMLDGETRKHHGISYLNGLQPDEVEDGKYVNVKDPSASTPSTSSECATRFTDEGDINVTGEGVDNRLFTVWVEYDGENLFVRYANGNFSEAKRPENPQIALEGGYLAKKFANKDVSIGFVSSISAPSAASHTVHSVVFANTYIENGITAEYIYNTKLTAAKEVMQGVLGGITVDNDTTKKDIQDTLDEALDQAGIAGVTVTVGDLTKTEPTTSAEGRIEAVISFECGTVRDSITMNKVLEKLPAPTPTAAPTETPVPPTAAPTSTPVLPTAAPTATPVPPTAAPTSTPVLPTAAPTATPVPPTAAPTGTPVSPITTPTSMPASPTATPVPPTAAPTGTPASLTTTPTVVPAVTPSPVPAIVPKKEHEKYELSLNARLKVSQAGKNINVSWGKISEADGYDVYVQYCGKKYTERSITAVKSGKTTQITLKKVNGKILDLKKNYKLFILAYKLADGRKVTLAKTITAHIVGKNNKTYTNAKAVKVKKNSYRLRKGKTAKISASTVLVEKGKKKLTDAHAKEFRYASTDKKVAEVSAKGKIKAVGKGKCTIYVYARNGFAKKIKVTVK